MSKNLRISRVLVTMALAAGIAPAAASAHDVWPAQGCDSGAGCVWVNQDYTGSMTPFTGSNPTWGTGWTQYRNDESSANAGTSTLDFAIFTGTSYGGTRSSCIRQYRANGHHAPLNGGRSNRWASLC